MRRRLVLITGLVAMQISSAATYDLASDFSFAVNPNGPWAYREGGNPLAFQANWLPGAFASAQPAWANSASGVGHIPVWFRATAEPLFATDYLLGDIVNHSTDFANGGSNGISNVVWTGTDSGLVDISLGVWLARNIGRAVDWQLFHNASLIASGSLFDGDTFDRSNPAVAHLVNRPLAISDTVRLEFITPPGAFGEFVGVNLTITTKPTQAVIPEPGTALLLFAALPAFALARASRRR